MPNKLPEHLKIYIGEQNYNNYTEEDQAVWRYTMRQLKDFLSVHAHKCYIDGLKKTGISSEYIPKISEVNAKLKKFGWGAVPVSGFIPPAAFMELQAHGFLPIASEMRNIEHIHYTPAPDIVHEAAGHAPIIVNKEFSNYLKRYAEISAKAIISKEDIELYEAIRNLSDAKELPNVPKSKIRALEKDLNEKSRRISFVSEAGLLSRMNWWTAEYGLIGSLTNPRIYGAGILSSIGESRNCLKHHVRKIPLDLSCLEYSYDITEQQPQLFVTPSFQHLTNTLEQMSKMMAYRQGGKAAMEKARQARTVNTIMLDTGLQISGLLHDFLSNDENSFYFKFNGPTQLSYANKQIPGHGKNYHKHGYSSPLGLLKGVTKCISKMSTQELKKQGIQIGRPSVLTFVSGVILSGTPQKIWKKRNKNLIIQFKNCTIIYNNEVLFHPSWGNFDLALGTKVISAYGGPADRKSYGMTDSFKALRIPRKKFSIKDKNKFLAYKQVRLLREKALISKPDRRLLVEFENLKNKILKQQPQLWLACLGLLEIYHIIGVSRPETEEALLSHLQKLRMKDKSLIPLIDDGIRLAATN